MSHVVTREEAGLRPPRRKTLLKADAIRGVVVHWSGSVGDQTHDHSVCDDIVRGWQNKHMAPGGLGAADGAVDIAYSSGVCPHGYRFRMRGPGVRTGANGTSKCNEAHHAVVAFGGPGYAPTSVQMEALREEVRFYNDQFPGPDEVKPHSDCKATQCCGDYLRGEIAGGYFGATPPPAPPTPPPTPPPAPAPAWPGIYLKKGMMNSTHVKDAQRKAAARGWKIAVDGDFGTETEKVVIALQKDKRQWMLDNGATAKQAAADGIIGPWTWRAIFESPVTR